MGGRGSLQVTNDFMLAAIRDAGHLDGAILDVGAGGGYFSRMLTAARGSFGKLRGDLQACDIFDSNFEADGVRFTQCDLNEGLPYPDQQFDAAVAIEVLEHTRAPYNVLRSVAHTLKPGGLFMFSVPNVGHMVSRVSYLTTGHYWLYSTPSARPELAGNIAGHVAPLPYQYWHYGLRTAGFKDIRLFPDRQKKSAAFFAALLWPMIKCRTSMRLRRLRAREPQFHAEIADVYRQSNSWTALTSRSLIFSARKP